MNTREMKDKFQEWQQCATESAKNLGRATDGYVRDNAWTSVALAVVLGAIAGFLLTRKES